MLTSGMVPALYNDEEKEQVIGQVRQHYLVYLYILFICLFVYMFVCTGCV